MVEAASSTCEVVQAHDGEEHDDDEKGVLDDDGVVVGDHCVNAVQMAAVVVGQEVRWDAYVVIGPSGAVPCAASAYDTSHVHGPFLVFPTPSPACLAPACLAHSHPVALHALCPLPEVPIRRVCHPADTPGPSTYRRSWHPEVRNSFHGLERAIVSRLKVNF